MNRTQIRAGFFVIEQFPKSMNSMSSIRVPFGLFVSWESRCTPLLFIVYSHIGLGFAEITIKI